MSLLLQSISHVDCGVKGSDVDGWVDADGFGKDVDRGCA